MLVEDKYLVGDAACLEVRNLHRGVENAQFDADGLRIASMKVELYACFLDTFHAALCFQCDPVCLIIAADAVLVVVGRELEFGGILVARRVVHAVYEDLLFLAFGTPIGDPVAVGIVFLINELALLSFIPDGSFGLEQPDDVYRIVE